jgi:hypothetical protein
MFTGLGQLSRDLAIYFDVDITLENVFSLSYKSTFYFYMVHGTALAS